jgi:hypothetical protein
MVKKVMDKQEIRAALDRHWEFTGVDIDRSHEIYHDFFLPQIR